LILLAFETGFVQSLSQSFHQSTDHMFQLPLPVLEKLARPVIVFLVLVLLLRVFGKRELAQLNPFDLVVLLSLSNTVQNAIIGEDNSVTGGLLGAFALLSINWLVARVLYRSRKLTQTFEGKSSVLVRNGEMDKKAMERESMTEDVLLSVLHRQGYPRLRDVGLLELEPNGTFNCEPRDPSSSDRQHQDVMERLDALSREMAALQRQISESRSGSIPE